MRILVKPCIRAGLLLAGFISVFLFTVASFAQQPSERIAAEIDDAVRATISGSHSPLARPENETGRMPAAATLQDIHVVFSHTLAQEADLQALLAAQQDPTSPFYHMWLTPEEFGARFGVADADIAKVGAWLEKHGFTVVGISRSKDRITFSGTVEQFEATFGIEMHYYKMEGETHHAPSQDVSVPTALSSLVLTVTNLSSFRPRPHLRLRSLQPGVSPNFTYGQNGAHFLTPKDVATIYDINPAYAAGLNGAGQSIAVVGQSDIVLTDIENFQTAAGLTPVKDPVKVLASSTNPGILPGGDEAESDLDLEYTSTIANGATIYFVYSSAGAFDALTYAVQNKTAPIISVSYGTCETALGSAGYSSLNGILAQAATQGQSVIAAAGDSGSTDCSGIPGLTTPQQQALAVDFPASSQYVTGLGGTEFPSADVAAGNTTYWVPASGSDVISSALSYIPEQVWNDDATGILSSGGGGGSTLTSRPTWQTGVPGIPSGTFRFVPDISLSSSPVNAAYLFCTSDTGFEPINGSCSHGFRDANNAALTTAGGTSFAAPVFAGMLALINQKLGKTQGLINPTLYTLAANSTTYASAFHDTTSGGNECLAGSTLCSGAAVSQYLATTGYDEASGLGSIDFANLLSAWPGSSTLAASKTTLMTATTTPAPGANDVITITVASASSSSTAIPTGTLTIVVDGVTQATSLALSNGTVTYTFSSTVIGSHTITATYSGNSTYAASTGSVTVTVTAVASKTTVAAATTTPVPGTNDPITITVASGSTSSTATPTGTVTIAVDGTPQSPTLTLSNGAATYTFSSTTLGSHTITATYSGDPVYAASTGLVTVTVTAVPSTTTLSAATLTPNAGASDTITISVVSGSSSSAAIPTGTVSIMVDGVTQGSPVTLTNGTAAYTFSSTVTGSHTITAMYSGNTTYAASSGSVSVTVIVAGLVASKTTLSAATITPTAGASDAIMVTVTSGSSSSTAIPTGTVSIMVDGVTQGSPVTLTNGTATYAFSSATTGSHTITATYSGNSTYGTSSGSLTATVSAAASKTALSAGTSAPAVGASDAITIVVVSGSSLITAIPTGTVTITVDGAVQGSPVTLASGMATYAFSSTATGSHTVTASYSGDSTYAASAGSITLTVTTAVSKTTLSAATTTPIAGASDAITVTVASGSSSSVATPTGTLTITLDGMAQTPALTLTNGSATYMFSSTVAGAHAITGNYSGDSTYAPSTGTLTVTVPPKSFKLAASSVTVTAGSSGASTVTITPQNGYNGMIAWTVSFSPALTNGCFTLPNTTVSGTSVVTAMLTVNTLASSCPAPAIAVATGSRHGSLGADPNSLHSESHPLSALRATQASMAVVGLLLVGVVGRRSRKFAMFASALILAGIGWAATGCASGGGSTAPPSNNTPATVAKGAYVVTIVGNDTVSSSVSASTTMMLTVD